MRLIFALVVTSWIAFVSDPAAAGVASPVTSTVPPCIVVCPQGDIADTVIARDIAGNPQPGRHIILSFDQCSGFSLCPPPPPASYTILSPTRIQVIADSHALAIFALQVTGACAGSVVVTADGVTLTDGTNRPLSSLVNVDQNGDGIVTSADQQVLAARAANDPLGDLNCDGVHNSADMAVLTAHMGHQCPTSAVPAHNATWGSVKIRYR
jgi:hypothetical protein